MVVVVVVGAKPSPWTGSRTGCAPEDEKKAEEVVVVEPASWSSCVSRLVDDLPWCAVAW
jgi:hypothetical protein